jgi:hypothetical protein
MGEEKLVLEIDGVVQTVPFVAHNGKTIFLVEIDLFPHDKPVSQRGALRAIRVTPLHQYFLDAGIDLDIGGDAWRRFVEDVRDRGQRRPVLVDENDEVIDGRQRLRACAELRIAPKVEVRAGLSWEAKLALWERDNLLRKHYTADDLAGIAAKARVMLDAGGLSDAVRASLAGLIAECEEMARCADLTG